LSRSAQDAGVPVYQTRVGTMFCTFFTDQPVTDWPSAKVCDTARFGRFFQEMLDRGVYLAPSQFEAAFFSTAHSGEVVEATIQAAQAAFAQLI
jgi:glutamate-1-semialdehyde 2,1-aminomutase